MAFGTYKSVQEVAKKYQIVVLVEPFVEPVPLPVDERFEQELAYVLRHIDVKMSEAAISEFLIAPMFEGNLEALFSGLPLHQTQCLASRTSSDSAMQGRGHRGHAAGG